ncbi:MAG: DUF4886 domain-containing protein [Bacteroidales bacterium]|nr:DUF4886 domain-containing protein [Bacteroidales bacterium]
MNKLHFFAAVLAVAVATACGCSSSDGPVESAFEISVEALNFKMGESKTLPVKQAAIKFTQCTTVKGWEYELGDNSLVLTAPSKGEVVVTEGVFKIYAIGEDGKDFDLEIPLSVELEKPVPDGKIRILAVGNSFSEDSVEQYLWEIAHDAGKDVIIGNMYIGGCSLETHLKNIKSNSGSYAYRKVVDGKKTSTINCQISRAFYDEPWDYVSIQQVSGMSGRYETYSTVPEILTLLNEKAPEATFMWHSTWAYQNGSTHGDFPKYGSDQMTMYNAIISATKQVLADNPSLKILIPSGTAVQNMRATSIGDTMNRDGYHLNYDYGRYTASCTWAAAVLGVDLSKVTWRPDTVDEATAALCRRAAADAVAKPYEVTVH